MWKIILLLHLRHLPSIFSYWSYGFTKPRSWFDHRTWRPQGKSIANIPKLPWKRFLGDMQLGTIAPWEQLFIIIFSLDQSEGLVEAGIIYGQPAGTASETITTWEHVRTDLACFREIFGALSQLSSRISHYMPRPFPSPPVQDLRRQPLGMIEKIHHSACREEEADVAID